MTGEYTSSIRPLSTNRLNSTEANWRNAVTLSAEFTIDIDGEKRHYTGTLKRDE